MVSISQPEIRTPAPQRVIYVERRSAPGEGMDSTPMDAQNVLHHKLDDHGLTNRISQGISMMPDGNLMERERSPRYRAGYMLTDDAPLPDEPEFHEEIFAPGKMAVFTYTGSWEHMGEAWGAVLGEALPASGLTLRPGTWFETYLDNPSVTPADQLRTEICLPIE